MFMNGSTCYYRNVSSHRVLRVIVIPIKISSYFCEAEPADPKTYMEMQKEKKRKTFLKKKYIVRKLALPDT